jgi:hypothetical protein
LSAADAAPNAFNNLHKVKILASLAATPTRVETDAFVRPAMAEPSGPESNAGITNMCPGSALRSTLIKTERTT